MDWHSRDLLFVKQLINLNNDLLWDLDSPRRSANWWMKQTSYISTIEKNLDMLPLTKLFLEKYSEDIETYQIRRLTKTFIEMKIKGEVLPRWRILRKAGLNDERMVSEAARFLLNVL